MQKKYPPTLQRPKPFKGIKGTLVGEEKLKSWVGLIRLKYISWFWMRFESHLAYHTRHVKHLFCMHAF